MIHAHLQSCAQLIARLGIRRYLVKPVVEERLMEILCGPSPGESPRAEPLTRAAVRPLRILVAEGNLVNQRVAIRFLERDGHALTIVSDGRAAVDQFQRQSFDMILMDVQMPVMDGLAAAHEIRRLERPSGLAGDPSQPTHHPRGRDKTHFSRKPVEHCREA